MPNLPFLVRITGGVLQWLAGVYFIAFILFVLAPLITAFVGILFFLLIRWLAIRLGFGEPVTGKDERPEDDHS